MQKVSFFLIELMVAKYARYVDCPFVYDFPFLEMYLTVLFSSEFWKPNPALFLSILFFTDGLVNVAKKEVGKVVRDTHLFDLVCGR